MHEVEFLNVFFCPFIAMTLLNKVRKEKNIFDINFVMNYAILCTLNMPFTKILVVIAEKLFIMKIELYSTYYTILAIVSAVILPYLIYSIRTNVSIKIKINKNSGDISNEEKNN